MNDNKIFYIMPRKYSYGGTMEVLVKLIPLAKYLKKKIKIIDILINPKKKGPLFIGGFDNSHSYKSLIYENEKFDTKGIDIIALKIDIILKIFIIRSDLFSYLVKIFFVIRYLNIKKAKEKFRIYFAEQNYSDGNVNIKNFDYLQKNIMNFKEVNYQEIFFNRESFDIKEIDKKIDYVDSQNKSICFYIREQDFNKKYIYLNKNNNRIWYKKKNFKKTLDLISNKNIDIFDLCNFKEDIELSNKKNYFNVKKLYSNSELLNYSIVKNCEFFLSTGGGKSDLAKLFKKPILRVDHEYQVIQNFNMSTKKDHIIFNHIYSKPQKRFLSIKEQFENLNIIFPDINSNTNFKFNHDQFLMVKNSADEIFNLVKNFSTDLNIINKNKLIQEEVFDIKRKFVKTNCPDYFYYGTECYPFSPLICKDFFKKMENFSDYLENKTIEFNNTYFK